MCRETFYYAFGCDYEELAEFRGENDAYDGSLGPYTTEEIKAASFSVAFGMVYGEPINDHVQFDTQVQAKESLRTAYVKLYDWDQEITCFKRCWLLEESEFRGEKVYQVLVDDADSSSGWFTEDRLSQQQTG
ncbi:MAG: hypothetical protein AAFQ89_14960 [Cyanobacteria bacterium J06626_18]